MDPIHYMEMQANYLRLLANYYSTSGMQKLSQPTLIGETLPPQESIYIESNTEEESKETEIKDNLEETQTYKKPAFDHDEIPIRPVAKTFEKLLEEEMKKNQELEGNQDETKSNHDFLKRTSLSIKPKSERKENGNKNEKRNSSDPNEEIEEIDKQNEKIETIENNEETQVKPFEEVVTTHENFEEELNKKKK